MKRRFRSCYSPTQGMKFGATSFSAVQPNSSASDKASAKTESSQCQYLTPRTAQSPRLRFSVGSHKVSYAKCLNLPETGPLAICHHDLTVEASRQTLIEQE